MKNLKWYDVKIQKKNEMFSVKSFISIAPRWSIFFFLKYLSSLLIYDKNLMSTLSFFDLWINIKN